MNLKCSTYLPVSNVLKGNPVLNYQESAARLRPISLTLELGIHCIFLQVP